MADRWAGGQTVTPPPSLRLYTLNKANPGCVRVDPLEEPEGLLLEWEAYARAENRHAAREQARTRARGR